VIALRAFLKYLSKRDVKTLAPEKIELAKTPSRQVEAVRGDELRRLLETVAKEPNELVRLRDLAIIHTLFASGVRISELVSLQINGVNLDTGEFTVRGKGDKLRLTFLSPEAVKAIRLYLSKRTDNNPALFVSHGRGSNSVTAQMDGQSRNTGLTARSVQRMLHQFGKLAGIVHKVTPHTLRHGFATDLLQNGADIRSVQTLLGHSSITTTQIYTHVTNAGLRDVHKKFHNKSESHE
jgi:site-specific recombinase XerD